MKGTELIERIKLYGAREGDEFEADFQNEQVYTAINVAMNEVNKLFPIKKTVRLLNYPCRPVAYHKLTVHKGGADTVFNASDIKSLAFAVSGSGTATLSGDGAIESKDYTWQDAAQFETIRAIVAHELIGYAGGEIKLTFTGEHSYLIKGLSFYGESDVDFAADVELYSEWVEYDIRGKYDGAFLGFSSLPVRAYDVRLNAPTDYRLEGDKVYLPANKEGEYTVEYYARPAIVNGDNGEAELDIDFRLHELVALKAAYYLYAVADPEAAQVCDAEYQKALGLAMTTMPVAKTPSRFRDVRGW